jgi:hypothetical protein
VSFPVESVLTTTRKPPVLDGVRVLTVSVNEYDEYADTFRLTSEAVRLAARVGEVKEPVTKSDVVYGAGATANGFPLYV